MLLRFLVLGAANAVALPAALLRAQPSPPSAGATQDVITILAGSPEHASFVAALSRTGIADQLRGAGPFTVFAPTDAAWDRIPINIRNDVLPPDGTVDVIRAAAAMNAYVLAGRYDLAELDGRVTEVVSRNGRILRIDAVDGKIRVALGGGSGFAMGGASAGSQAANVVGTGRRASNGMVYVIDGPLVT